MTQTVLPPDPTTHQEVRDAVADNATDAESRLQALENNPTDFPLGLTSRGYDLGQELNLPGLGPTITLNSASVAFGTGTNTEVLDVDVLLQAAPNNIAAYDFALVDSAAMVDADSVFKNSGIIDPAAGIQSQVQNYVAKTATGFASSAALYADTTLSNANVSVTVNDDGSTEIQLNADVTELTGIMKFGSALQYQLAGDAQTPFGALPSLIGYEHVHGSSALIPQPNVLDADIIGGCLVGTTFEVTDLIPSQRFINSVTTRDDIGGNISEVFSEIDRGADSTLRTRSSLNVRTPLRDADISASAYNDGSDDLAEVRMYAQDETGGSTRAIRLELKANDVRTIARIEGLGSYVDNNAATLAGLAVDELYKTPTGEIRIVV